uniref:U1-type domain-containing protein n=1 Tax=Bubo bubo TaxID=30461 RepID=A0A8C0F061_BUBBB
MGQPTVLPGSQQRLSLAPGELSGREKKHQSFTLCEVCNIQLNSAAQAQIHYNGKSHQKRLKQLNKGKMPPGQGRTRPTGPGGPKAAPAPGSARRIRGMFGNALPCPRRPSLAALPELRALPPRHRRSSRGFGAGEPTRLCWTDGWTRVGPVRGQVRFLVLCVFVSIFLVFRS